MTRTDNNKKQEPIMMGSCKKSIYAKTLVDHQCLSSALCLFKSTNVNRFATYKLSKKRGNVAPQQSLDHGHM